MEAADAAGRAGAPCGGVQSRRRDLIGIIDWRLAEAKRSAVDFRLRRLRRRATSCAQNAPTSSSSPRAACRTEVFLSGEDLVLDTWDVMGGAAHPQRIRPGLRRQRRRARHGRRRAPGRHAARRSSWSPRSALSRPCVGSMNSPAYLRAFAEHDVTRDARLPAAGGHRRPSRAGASRTFAASTPTSRSSAASTTWWSSTARCPTTSSTSTWCPARATSAPWTTRSCWPGNRRPSAANPDGDFDLFRIGDAVASRNIHAATYDALRLCLPI